MLEQPESLYGGFRVPPLVELEWAGGLTVEVVALSQQDDKANRKRNYNRFLSVRDVVEFASFDLSS